MFGGHDVEHGKDKLDVHVRGAGADEGGAEGDEGFLEVDGTSVARRDFFEERGDVLGALVVEALGRLGGVEEIHRDSGRTETTPWDVPVGYCVVSSREGSDAVADARADGAAGE